MKKRDGSRNTEAIRRNRIRLKDWANKSRCLYMCVCVCVYVGMRVCDRSLTIEKSELESLIQSEAWLWPIKEGKLGQKNDSRE